MRTSNAIGQPVKLSFWNKTINNQMTLLIKRKFSLTFYTSKDQSKSS